MASYENPVGGTLVAIEGIDGVGKTSITAALPAALGDCRVGLTVTGEKRSPLAPLLENGSLAALSPLLKTLIFAADRAWTYEIEALPALRRGDLVIWDRYVATALVYRQVEVLRGDSDLDMDYVCAVNGQFPAPQITVLLVADPDVCRARAPDRVHDAGFLSQAAQLYSEFAREYDWVVVDGTGPVARVVADVARHLRERVPRIFG